MSSVKRALISVSDKTGVVEFAQELEKLGMEIISTGGTAKLLADAGVKIIEISDYTGFPEMLDGRVKTLHPKVHGGILARRDLKEHMDTLSNHDIGTIDLVCVNLYPFKATIEKQGCTLEDAIENIDIGGPAMVRSAAKNWRFVAIVTDTQDYSKIIQELKSSDKHQLSEQTLFTLSAKAFSHTAQYDGLISNYLTSVNLEKLSGEPELKLFSQQLNQQWLKVQDLRYGENPHQKAAFYRDIEPLAGSLSSYQQLQGKELSYNNLADSDAAWEAVKAFDEPACVIVKHANPCGVAVAEDTLSAYLAAYETDKTSAFGGIIAFNREVDEKTVETILVNQFMEVLMAPGFNAKALELMKAKKNVRVLKIPLEHQHNQFEMKRIGGGLLLQTPDIHLLSKNDLKVVSKRQPDDSQLKDLLFLWKVTQFVKSNAVVFGKEGRTYGVGAGQMSRVDSTLIAARKAKEAGLDLTNAAAASDAFFPFRDGVDVIAEQGIKVVIHPGGSIRDEEVIQAADEHDMVMVLTGIRHFRH
ncbi:bifunctional phosphoribosylaminoimidazolecarboxamide formyltransferase/IMP cyclohydrolase [Neisseriaceae bacterium PsAf]|nr:bifunctional phosphoribosylaminoimidazolecarboxamide formyltransferase/IMP cyclohydrolase [Neisseriaceae bacterium PsAf]MCV2502717.1 bifunctional phosphoribosylaminoimidazolecarboxamide formyltransferase/IMP cyclohydrolase [Neisseriaceae bacterium]